MAGIHVDAELCTGCACCVLCCPTDAIDTRPEFVASIDDDACTECLSCFDACPPHALSED